ncbi:hypothetical protein [Virgibacillus sediminis]|uniref:DUF3679 domain-containing protein n=1 Tax=Virgibacillus sediminis TaxID=202260 RepID=A0ABV7A5P7_9BACI
MELRTVIVILLLAVFFMGGMVYGMERSSYSEPVQKQEEFNYVAEGEVIEENQPDKYVHTPGREALSMEEPEHFTHRAASVLEVAVRGFYEAIVAIMYGISELFV